MAKKIVATAAVFEVPELEKAAIINVPLEEDQKRPTERCKMLGTRRPKSIMSDEILLKTEDRNVQMRLEKSSGNICLRCAAWEEDRFIYPAQELVVRAEEGQIHLRERVR